ncbi:hypothetical protein [Reyranella sp.]|uniref:hypothetical protein n=1 Tax=Reyranella sp. TaxID=1929291 RepID=UPI003BAA8594
MSEPYMIEVWGEPAGVLIESNRRFCFFAVSHRYAALSGSSYRTRGHARLAAVNLRKDASK